MSSLGEFPVAEGAVGADIPARGREPCNSVREMADRPGGGTRSGAFAVRGTLLVAGSTLCTLCYAVTIKASLGLGPLFVLQDGLARQLGISIGTAVIVTGFAFVAMALALRSWPGPGTLVLPVLSGVTLDAILPHVPALHGLALELVAVLVATWLMALGAAMTIRASVGVAAYDAVMLGLRRVLGRPLGPTRLAMEATVLVAGWVLGGAVGLGTVITGLLIGPGIAFWVRIVGASNAPSAMARPLVARSS